MRDNRQDRPVAPVADAVGLAARDDINPQVERLGIVLRAGRVVAIGNNLAPLFGPVKQSAIIELQQTPSTVRGDRVGDRQELIALRPVRNFTALGASSPAPGSRQFMKPETSGGPNAAGRH